MAVEIVEPVLPEHPERFDPVGDVFHPVRIQAARPPLRIPACLDEAGGLQYLEVLRDSGLAEREGLGEFRDSCLAKREPGKDGSSGRIAQGGKGCIQ